MMVRVQGLALLLLAACAAEERPASDRPAEIPKHEKVSQGRWVGEVLHEGGAVTLHQAFEVTVPRMDAWSPLAAGTRRSLDDALVVAMGIDHGFVVGWEEVTRATPPEHLADRLAIAIRDRGIALERTPTDVLLVIDEAVPWQAAAHLLERLRQPGTIERVTFVASGPSEVELPPAGAIVPSPIWAPFSVRLDDAPGGDDLPQLDGIGDAFASCPRAQGMLATLPTLDLDGRVDVLRDALPDAIWRCEELDDTHARQQIIALVRGRDPRRIDVARAVDLGSFDPSAPAGATVGDVLSGLPPADGADD